MKLPGFRAAMMPSGMAITVASTIELMTSNRVIGSRSNTMSSAGRSSHSELPKSKRVRSQT